MSGPVSDSKRSLLRRPPLSEHLLRLGAPLPSLGGGRYVSTLAGCHPCWRGAPALEPGARTAPPHASLSAHSWQRSTACPEASTTGWSTR